MPRTLTLSLDGQDFAVHLVKIDRDRLYGSVEVEAFDEKGKPATIKVLAADGRTLIDKGGTALAAVDETGTSVSRTELMPVDDNGDPIEPVPSSFDQTNVLKRAEAEEYLSQMVKSVYVLEAADEASLDYLLDHTAAKQIFTFPFSYRGGVEYDNAFVLGHGSDAFLVLGKQADLQFVRLNQTAALHATEEEEITGDEIDFESL